MDCSLEVEHQPIQPEPVSGFDHCERLIQIVDETQPRHYVNAFVYTLLLHEYLHALGHIREDKVRFLVYRIAKECFGEEHMATKLAERGPWTLIRRIPIGEFKPSRGFMEIVKDFEKSNHRYIA